VACVSSNQITSRGVSIDKSALAASPLPLDRHDGSVQGSSSDACGWSRTCHLTMRIATGVRASIAAERHDPRLTLSSKSIAGLETARIAARNKAVHAERGRKSATTAA